MPAESAQLKLRDALSHSPAFMGYADGGEVNTDSIKATEPEHPWAAHMAGWLKSADDWVRENNPPVQIISDLLGVPGIHKTLDRIGYGESLTTGKGMTTKMKPDTEEALFAAPMVVSGAGELTGLAKKYGVPAAQAMAKNAMVPSTLSKEAGVIKAPGGNWLSGSVEDSLKGLKRNRSAEDAASIMADTAPENAWMKGQFSHDQSINNWIDKKLASYVKNDMATERDPVRALAEKGPIHFDPGNDLFARRHIENRMKAGMPVEDAGTSIAAKNWENVSDAMVMPDKAGNYLQSPGEPVRINPWLAKVPPETDVYRPGGQQMQTRLGFDHLIDELRNATNPASGLPANLMWKPEDLSKVTMPQAVERVAKINEWRAAQKAEADMMKANNAATVLHKEYPEQGMKWVELKAPPAKGIDDLTEEQAAWYSDYIRGGVTPERALREASNRGDSTLKDALKYEGDTMGHCVGEYCDDVASGASRIFSLRDKKGQPHVTIEVKPNKPNPPVDLNNMSSHSAARIQAVADELASGGTTTQEHLNAARDQLFGTPKDKLLQIKGKGNRKPNDEYLPFVQDFVKSGKWSDVGDLQNSNLRRFGDAWNVNEEKTIRAAGIDIPPFLSQAEIDAINAKVWPKKEGFAQGGLVSGHTPYDPTYVDALAAQFQNEFA